ncbi:MAG TPA: Fe-S protein assembly co-chaperone HscB [Candidatus Binatia bacterium]|nr:Fe-S protein assembly co-chaperone HscB [Candidatus Binatia bacterium]
MSPTPAAPVERASGASTASETNCWQCGTAHPAALFCAACESIQPFAPGSDYFDILGIPRRVSLDARELEQRYFELSRRVHPDLYQTGPSQARIISLGNTASLNRAFRTLRDPLERGLYWLRLQGDDLSRDNNQVPADLASLVFEIQEQLENFRASGRPPAVRDELRQTRAELTTRRDHAFKELHDNFIEWDAGRADRAALTQELKSILSTIKYLRTLIRDLDRELEG